MRGRGSFHEQDKERPPYGAQQTGGDPFAMGTPLGHHPHVGYLGRWSPDSPHLRWFSIGELVNAPAHLPAGLSKLNVSKKPSCPAGQVQRFVRPLPPTGLGLVNW